jgi:hypothetical protein
MSDGRISVGNANQFTVSPARMTRSPTELLLYFVAGASRRILKALWPRSEGMTVNRNNHRLHDRRSDARIAHLHPRGLRCVGDPELEMRPHRRAVVTALQLRGVGAENECADAGDNRDDRNDPFRLTPKCATPGCCSRRIIDHDLSVVRHLFRAVAPSAHVNPKDRTPVSREISMVRHQRPSHMSWKLMRGTGVAPFP